MQTGKLHIPISEIDNKLSERENAILRTIIHLYILNASPIGSRNLSKYLEKELRLSPASIRNIMSDLEDMDLICHLHTSAGRIPTDKGYRYYVDSLMDVEQLTEKEVQTVKDQLSPGSTSETVLKNASVVLGMLSKYLAVVAIPHITDLIVHKIELIRLSSDRLLAVIALESNIVRTVTLEADFVIDTKYLDDISSYINEKISGKPLRFVRDNFKELISGIDSLNTPLIRLFLDSVNQIFQFNSATERIHIAGAQNLVNHPEFDDLDRMRGVIELIENEDVIVHLLDKYDDTIGTKILIGKELQSQILEDYSLVVSNYSIGSASGSIGLIGPKRMNYSRMISLVDIVSEIISKD